MFDPRKFIVIGGTGNHDLDAHVLREINKLGHTELEFSHLDIDLYPDREDAFEIQEYEKLSGRHVIIFQSVYDVSLKERFLTLIWAAKYQYKARSVIAVVPFMIYRRQERAEKEKEINRNRMFIHQGIVRKRGLRSGT